MKQASKLGMIMSLALAGLGHAAWANEGAAEGATDVAGKLAVCASCHGENGDKPLAPDYPILAGQYADYLAIALHAYKSGRRQHPIMSMQAQMLNDAEIKGLAEHFASKPGLHGLGE